MALLNRKNPFTEFGLSCGVMTLVPDISLILATP